MKNVENNQSKITYLNLLFCGRQFALKGYSSFSPKYCRKQQWKIIYHIFLNPKFAKAWFHMLNLPFLNNIFVYRPLIYIKPFRVYISTQWNKEKKVKVIMDSYRFILTEGYNLEEVITNKEGMVIANLMMNDTVEGILKLGYDNKYRKEGEFVLSFECDELGGKAVSVAFSIEEYAKGQWHCVVGCVQGHITHEVYKLSQKLLHGLRPNSLIIYSLQELARQLGLNRIYCAGDSIQAYRKKHAIHIPRLHDISFDYNKFWLESGGQEVSEGWFELPLIPVRKKMEDIKSKKRSMYNKRYRMLDNISQKVEDTIRTSICVD